MKAPDKIYIYKHRYYENQFDIEWGEDRIHDDDIEYTRSDLIPQWQPIETAPKDGTAILLFDEDGISIGKWYEPKEDIRLCHWCCDTCLCEACIFGDAPLDIINFQAPTHWIPLPSPPRVLK